MACSSQENSVQLKCNSIRQTKALWIFDRNDCVFENGEFVRLKRKYGKFKREIIKVE